MIVLSVVICYQPLTTQQHDVRAWASRIKRGKIIEDHYGIFIYDVQHSNTCGGGAVKML